MGHIIGRTQDSSQALDLSTLLSLSHAAQAARKKRRQLERQAARKQKLAMHGPLQPLADALDRAHAAWVAAGEPEYDGSEVA